MEWYAASVDGAKEMMTMRLIDADDLSRQIQRGANPY